LRLGQRDRELPVPQTNGRRVFLRELNGRYGPLSIMASDGNSKPVQIIKPHILNSSGFSVGEDNGFADKFELRLSERIHYC
jgi:hypothetical protein